MSKLCIWKLGSREKTEETGGGVHSLSDGHLSEVLLCLLLAFPSLEDYLEEMMNDNCRNMF